MPREITLSIKDMSPGLRVRQDSPNEPAGSFRVMRNSRITDRGGVAKRQGISVIGDYDSSGSAVKGLVAYEKADGTKTLIKAKGTVHQYLDTTWENFETGLTASDTDYAPFIVNNQTDDFLVYSSRDNGYKVWHGYIDRSTSALVGGETTIPVTTTLKADVFFSGTASSVTTTTIDVSGTPWATDQWNNFYVLITSGATSGTVRKITDTDSNTITFASIGALAGTPTFEVRLLALPDTGTILVGGTSVAYTAVPTSTGITVASAPAAADDSAVVEIPISYPGAPKGSALAVWLTKMFVANIKSAVTKDGAGNTVATAASRALYVSATGNATDFAFSAPRSADEGDVIEFAYGGGKVLDVVEQENKIYAGTPNYIESIDYTQSEDASGDPTDIAQRDPLKPGIGITGRFIKGKDDVYFFTPAGEFTSIGRVANADVTPQSLDIGFPIRRLLENRVNDEADGLEWKNRIHIAHKEDSDSTFNDIMLVYNRGTKSFEGDWLLPASKLVVWDGKPAFGTANGANVMQMYTGEADVWNGVEYAISSEVKSNWINVTPTGMEDQSITGFHVGGYIRGNSSATYYLYADWSDTPVLTVNFSGSESDLVYNVNVSGALGETPLGELPMGSFDEPDAEGYRRFRFTVWFPDIYCTHWSWGWKSSGKNEYIETNQVGVSVSSDPLSVHAGLVKTI